MQTNPGILAKNPPLDGHKQIFHILRGKANIINAMMKELITSNI